MTTRHFWLLIETTENYKTVCIPLSAKSLWITRKLQERNVLNLSSKRTTQRLEFSNKDFLSSKTYVFIYLTIFQRKRIMTLDWKKSHVYRLLKKALIQILEHWLNWASIDHFYFLSFCIGFQCMALPKHDILLVKNSRRKWWNGHESDERENTEASILNQLRLLNMLQLPMFLQLNDTSMPIKQAETKGCEQGLPDVQDNQKWTPRCKKGEQRKGEFRLFIAKVDWWIGWEIQRHEQENWFKELHIARKVEVCQWNIFWI